MQILASIIRDDSGTARVFAGSAPRRALVVLLLLAACVVSCEQTLDPDVPYVERIVVQAYLDAGDTAPSVSITRTIPLNAPVDESGSWIADVEARIESADGTWPLRYDDSGRYVADGLIVTAATRYTLKASWNGHTVVSNTTVPPRPAIDTAWPADGTLERYVHDGGDDFGVAFRPAANAVYAVETSATLADSSGNGGRIPLTGWIDELYEPRDTAADGTIRAVIHPYLEFVDQSATDLTLYYTVRAYDEPFVDFWNTYGYGGDEDAFSTGSDHVRWNVTGDGIGLFMGRSSTTVTIR